MRGVDAALEGMKVMQRLIERSIELEANGQSAGQALAECMDPLGTEELHDLGLQLEALKGLTTIAANHTQTIRVAKMLGVKI